MAHLDVKQAVARGSVDHINLNLSTANILFEDWKAYSVPVIRFGRTLVGIKTLAVGANRSSTDEARKIFNQR